MDRSAGHSIQKRVDPLPFAHQHLGHLLQHPLPHPPPPLRHPCLSAREVRVGAVFAVHAVAAQEVVLADGEFGGAVVEGLGVHGEGIVVDEGAAEGVASELILASLRQADLALEEDVFGLVFSLPYFLGFCLVGAPPCRPVSQFMLSHAAYAHLAHAPLTNKNNINHHSFPPEIIILLPPPPLPPSPASPFSKHLFKQASKLFIMQDLYCQVKMAEGKDKKEYKVISNLEKFINTYGNNSHENFIASIDVETILKDLSSNILEPNTDDQEINNLYQRGISLNKEMALEIVPKLKSIKEEKVPEILQFIEYLDKKLNNDYEDEVRRGIEFGVYDKGEKQSQKS